MQTLDIGEIVPIRTTWWDENDAPANPTTIALTITKPDGSTVVKAKTDMTQGPTTDVWLYDQVVDQAGVWRVHALGAVGAGARTVIQEFMFLAGIEPDAGGPCEPWCTRDDATECSSTPPTLTAPAWELAIDQASELLFKLSGRRYPGLCTVTRSLCFSCAVCYPTACSCVPYPSIDLGGRYPVWAVYDVKIGGVALPQSAYTLRGRRYLVRLDGDVWPLGSDTIVSWIHGRKPPVGGRAAAAQLAYEIALLCAGDKRCSLPQRVTTVQREGISYTILDNMTMIKEGRTGLPSVDMWLTADALAAKPGAHIYHPALGPTSRMQ